MCKPLRFGDPGDRTPFEVGALVWALHRSRAWRRCSWSWRAGRRFPAHLRVQRRDTRSLAEVIADGKRAGWITRGERLKETGELVK